MYKLLALVLLSSFRVPIQILFHPKQNEMDAQEWSGVCVKVKYLLLIIIIILLLINYYLIIVQQ